MKTIYVIYYSTGEYDYFYEIEIFATFDKNLALSYVEKFNRIRNKWMSYYTDLNSSKGLNDNSQYRYYQILDINPCYYKEIEVRQFSKLSKKLYICL